MENIKKFGGYKIKTEKKIKKLEERVCKIRNKFEESLTGV